jgi:predicted dehydrogenase
MSGTNGSIDFPNLETKTYDTVTSPSWWSKFKCGKIAVNPVDPLSAQIEHFIDVVSKKSTPRVSAEDGLENMLVLEAIRESSKTNAAIEMKNFKSKLLR